MVKIGKTSLGSALQPFPGIAIQIHPITPYHTNENPYHNHTNLLPIHPYNNHSALYHYNQHYTTHQPIHADSVPTTTTACNPLQNATLYSNSKNNLKIALTNWGNSAKMGIVGGDSNAKYKG